MLSQQLSRTTTALIVCLIVVSVGFVHATATAAGTVDQSQLEAMDQSSFFGLGGPVTDVYRAAQTFTVGREGIMDQVDVLVSSNSACIGCPPPTPVQVEIRGVRSDGTPDAQTLSTGTIRAIELTGADQWFGLQRFIDITLVSVQLSPALPVRVNDRYAIVLTTADEPQGNYWTWWGVFGADSDPYPRGEAFQSADAGQSWTPVQHGTVTADWDFRTYVRDGMTTCEGIAGTIIGTPEDDSLIGTPGSDVIVGGDGADTIDGGSGNDTVCGGLGDDAIVSGEGLDTVFGHAGDDFVSPGEGNDVVIGGPGWDCLSYAERTSATGVDNFFNIAGHDANADGDLHDAGDERDVQLEFECLETGSGNDFLVGGPATETFVPGEGDDAIEGHIGQDWVDWSGSSSGLVIDPANSTVTGQGTDIIHGITMYIGSRFNDVLLWDRSTDRFLSGLGSDTVDARTQTARQLIHLDRLDGIPVGGVDAPQDHVENVLGGSGPDTLLGNDLANGIGGNAGNDDVFGRASSDLLGGGRGDDELFGETGNDKIIGGEDLDTADGGVGRDSCSVEAAIRCERPL